MKEKNKKVEEKEAGRKKKRTEKKEEKKKKVEELTPFQKPPQNQPKGPFFCKWMSRFLGTFYFVWADFWGLFLFNEPILGGFFSFI